LRSETLSVMSGMLKTDTGSGIPAATITFTGQPDDERPPWV
jgi:hypothetical protein